MTGRETFLGTDLASRAAASAVSRPQIDLVLACASACLEGVRRERVNSLVATGLDWNAAIRIAQRHGTLPLLAEFFCDGAHSQVPTDVADQLREARRTHALRCLQFTGELLKIIGCLRSRGIRVLTFKGPTLALLAYGDITRRQYNDLDFWVHPADFPRASELLTELGFHSRFQAAPQKERHERRETGHLLFENNENVLVELHERLTGNEFHFPAEFDDWWSRRMSVDLGGEQLDTFSLDDLVFYLCVHGAKHSWCNLGWICDCGELLRRQPEIDWPGVLARARAAHCQRILLLGVSLAHVQSGIAIPPPLAALLASDATVPGLTRQVHRDLFSTKRPVWAHALLGFRSRDRLRDSLQHSLSLLFVTRQADWDSVDLSPALWRIYPLLRPFRLMLKYLRQIVRSASASMTRLFARRDEP